MLLSEEKTVTLKVQLQFTRKLDTRCQAMRQEVVLAKFQPHASQMHFKRLYMSKGSCVATESTLVRLCEWRGLNCYFFIQYFVFSILLYMRKTSAKIYHYLLAEVFYLFIIFNKFSKYSGKGALTSMYSSVRGCEKPKI